MKSENEHVEMVESEDVANQEQPVIIQPKIIPPRVLLEILVFGTFEPNSDPKESETYKKALELQNQINTLRGKDKLRVRILWKTFESSAPLTYDQAEELKEWLIENASCKYYHFIPYVIRTNYKLIAPGYVKDLLKEIKNFEKAIVKFKESKIELKRK
jgi:hypothetical protein